MSLIIQSLNFVNLKKSQAKMTGELSRSTVESIYFCFPNKGSRAIFGNFHLANSF